MNSADLVAGLGSPGLEGRLPSEGHHLAQLLQVRGSRVDRVEAAQAGVLSGHEAKLSRYPDFLWW